MPETQHPRDLLSLCGDVRIVDAHGAEHPVRGIQPQVTLAALALAEAPLRREEIADLLWADQALPDHWAGAVRGVLTKVRRSLVAAGLDGSCLVTDGGAVRLDLPPPMVTDVAFARQRVADASAALEVGDAEVALAAAMAASAAVAGVPLASADGDWVRRLQDDVAELRSRAAALVIHALLHLGRAADAAAAATELIRLDALDEAAHHLRVEALIADGRPGAAVQAYEELAAGLDRELGISPSDATTALVEALSTASPRPAQPVRVPTLVAPDRARDLPRAAIADATRFLGRRDELSQVEELWHTAARGGRPRVLVIEGPTGIGKTRLAQELARRTADDGGRVLWGRCRSGASIAYEPVIDAVDHLLRADPGVVERVGDRLGGLVGLLPELAGSVAAVVPSSDPDVARAQLFRSVVALFDDPATATTLWVVDDVQWASGDTLALVEYVVDHVELPLLLVATARDLPPAAQAALASISRRVPVTAVSLSGLDEADLVELASDLGDLAVEDRSPVGGSDPRALAHALFVRTQGHPFFLHEIVGDARRSGAAVDLDRVPDAVRDWVGRRVGALDPTLTSRIELASVIGMDVDVGLLTACSPDDRDSVVARCEELVGQGLLGDSADPEQFRFEHVITHDVIYDGIGAARRARLHHRVAEALAARTERASLHAEIAHHLGRSGPSARVGAAEHAIAAGDDAMAVLAWELAAEQFSTAAALADAAGEAGLLARALIGLGRARHRNLDVEGASEALTDAVEVARANDLPLDQAAAVLALVGRAGRGAGAAMADADHEALIRDALRALDVCDDPRADGAMGQLEGELALSLLLTDASDERTALVSRTLERARAARPVVPAHLAQALLNRRISLLAPDQLHDRLADLDEILALPASELGAEVVIAAHCYRHEDRLRAGDRGAAAADLVRAGELAEQVRSPYWQWVVATWRTLGSIIDGDLDHAEQDAVAATALPAAADTGAAACLGVNLVDIRLYQRRVGEVLDLLALTADQHPEIPCYRAVLALCASEAGQRETAERNLAVFVDRNLANLPVDTNRFLGLVVLGHTAADLEDRSAAAVLLPLLEPYRGQQVLLNCYGGGGAYWGPASHVLARLRTLVGGISDGADALFAEAEAQAIAFGAPLAADRIATERASVAFDARSAHR